MRSISPLISQVFSESAQLAILLLVLCNSQLVPNTLNITRLLIHYVHLLFEMYKKYKKFVTNLNSLISRTLELALVFTIVLYCTSAPLVGVHVQ